MMAITQRHMDWRNGRDTGLSSVAIWNHMLGIAPAGSGFAYPHDPDDLKRCVRLLEAFPEWRDRMPEMAEHGPFWAALVEVWDEIVGLLAEECPGPRGTAPRCYARMEQALNAARRPVAP